jgi:hypothetical protein
MLIEFEMAIDHILKQIVDYEVESETGIFGGINTHTCLESSIISKPHLSGLLQSLFAPGGRGRKKRLGTLPDSHQGRLPL